MKPVKMEMPPITLKDSRYGYDILIILNSKFKTVFITARGHREISFFPRRKFYREIIARFEWVTPEQIISSLIQNGKIEVYDNTIDPFIVKVESL